MMEMSRLEASLERTPMDSSKHSDNHQATTIIEYINTIKIDFELIYIIPTVGRMSTMQLLK
jgi:hypothetical protein